MISRKPFVFILAAFFLSSCIGPLYNPFPISKLTARVGPPLKINSENVSELYITESVNPEQLDNSSIQENSASIEVIDLKPEIKIFKVDEKTLKVSWDLQTEESLILPPKDIVQAVKKECNNNTPGHLITFSSFESKATAIFKCW